MSPTTPRFCTTEQAQTWEKLGLPLDRYGETPLFNCLECGADSLKVAVPVDLAHCTACGMSWSANRLAGLLEQRIVKQPEADPAPEQVAIEIDETLPIRRLRALLEDRAS